MNNLEQIPEINPTELRTLSICIINPKIDPSFWGFDYALPLLPGDKRCRNVTGALPALAALTPEPHKVTLLDENVEIINFSNLDQFDLIGVTGLITQRKRMREILEALKVIDALIVVGGAYANVDEAFFDGYCDVLFSGEAETTWPQFISDFAAGRPILKRYQQAEKTDMTTVPTQRFDLLKADRYVTATVQFSRGCPFLCEFCDIIVVFGRRPRLKTPEQLIKEMEALHQAGFRNCFIVDDNFFGNKREVRKMLKHLIVWQENHDFPVTLSTEASINLADDPEFMSLMVQANFRHVFVGIESPRAASLQETRKVQNIHGDSLETRLARIRAAGLVVDGGFIVGFDNDDSRIFDEQFDFIQKNHIGCVAVGVLTAIPTTPLYQRLEREGRLALDDENCNFEPKNMSRAELKSGSLALLQRLYQPDNFLDRIFAGYFGQQDFKQNRDKILNSIRRKYGIKNQIYGFLMLVITGYRLTRTLWQEGCFRTIGSVYITRYFSQALKHGSKRMSAREYLSLCVTHWHFYKFSKEAGRGALLSPNFHNLGKSKKS